MKTWRVGGAGIVVQSDSGELRCSDSRSDAVQVI